MFSQCLGEDWQAGNIPGEAGAAACVQDVGARSGSALLYLKGVSRDEMSAALEVLLESETVIFRLVRYYG